MNEHTREELIEKLFQNRCTEEDLKKLIQMIQHSSRPPDQRTMERLWDEVKDYPRLQDSISKSILAAVLNRIEVKPEEETGFAKPGRSGILPYKYLAIAASLLILLASAVWIFSTRNSMDVIETAFGEQRSLQLSDGSRVRLNANSTVKYPPNWVDDQDRQIWLEGEAFFEVEKKPESQQKFHVITRDVIVEVLGTTFNVNTQEDQTTVYLEEGKVQLFLPTLDSTIEMDEGDLVIYSQSDGHITHRQREMADIHTSWKDGVLTFRGAPLIEVVNRVEDIYGVTIEVRNMEDHTREINFPLPVNDLETAISVLDKTVTGLTIRRESEVYVIE